MKYILTLIIGFILGYIKGKLSSSKITLAIKYGAKEKSEVENEQIYNKK